MKNLDLSQREIVESVLRLEHANFASKIGFRNEEIRNIDGGLLNQAVALVDQLSRKDDEFSKRVAVLLVALCWELSIQSYHDSLREIFTVILSRMGIAPSTMLIDQTYRQEGVHSPFTSYINEISVLANHLTHEINISGQVFLLTTFQKDVWDSIDKNRVVGVSAPTSAGKSFALYLKIADMIINGSSSFLYIVPTISLVNQVAKDLSKLFRHLDIRDIDIFTNYQDNHEGITVYVLTQERSIAAFSANDSFNGLDLLIVDEVQNIERVANEDDQRSKVLYDVLKELKHVVVPKKIVLSGPRLQNIGNLGFEIFEEVSDVAETKLPPVVNLTYSVSKRGKRYYFSQYCDIHSIAKELSIQNFEKISGIGGSIYNDNFHEYLRSVISKFREEEINLIFSPNPNQARKTALYLSKFIENFPDSTLLDELSDYIKQFVHPDYDLAEIVRHGIAYHTGRLPLHVRAAVEEAFSLGLLNNVVCTTTLMQGVNFPASNIIVRNPNLFIKRQKGVEPPKLSNYEFSNLRGRAGRLLKDFIGRTVVLDESFFESDSPQGSLFEDTEKELTAGYGDYFEKYKEEIYDRIENDSVVETGPEKHILTHIRQTIYRLGRNGIERLQEVGIRLEEDYFDALELSINSLKAPRNVVLKNRYWDPLDIEMLFELLKNKDIPTIPNNIWAPELAESLINSTRSVANYLPSYYHRYLGSDTGDRESFIWSICNYAQRWGREELLSSILNSRNFGDEPSNAIDRAVQVITSKVAYGLPMLLKPLAELSSEDNSVLSCIELGAYSKLTKFLISKGVPRDTAVYLRHNYLSSYEEEVAFDIKELSSKLLSVKTNIGTWMSAQLAVITG